MFTELRGQDGPPAPATALARARSRAAAPSGSCATSAWRDGCVGSVLVETDMRRVEARRRDTLTIFFGAFVASLGLAYVLGAALQRPLVKPLRQLSVAADEVMRTERFDVAFPSG